MKLYHFSGACSLAVHIALREVGADFQLISVDFAKQSASDGRNFKEISPRGYVPVLEFNDGTRHTEVASLLQYVADTDPSQKLIGGIGTTRRLAVVEWISFVSTELHKSFGWLWQKDCAESTLQQVKEKLSVRFAEMDELLAHQNFLAGDYSVADAYAFTVVNWCNFIGFPLTSTPHLVAYLGRVAARTKVQESLLAEGLLNK